jgi:putative SOS response-associated peptidase YedK
MCNLYKVRKSQAEVAAYFGVTPSDIPMSNTPDDILPRSSGFVVRERDGAPIMQAMTWGFPLKLKGMKPDSKPLAVNNIADLRKAMWSGLAKKPEWRCLIPVTEFAEAEGPKGRTTRTWVNVKGQPIFAWGGLWRESAEWGPVYSGVMTDCNEAMRPLHDRMPVLLHKHEHEKWLRGSFEDLLSFQDRCFPDDLIEMTRTSDLWVSEEARAASAAKAKARAEAKRAAKAAE